MEHFIGQERWQRFFSVAIEHGTLSHAYLFSGPEHIGKKTFIRSLALTILGQPKEEPVSLLHPDLLTLAEEGEATVSVEAVRHFSEAVLRTPLSGRRRVAVIPNADRLSLQSWNALLKTLEEPSKTTTFLLAAEHAERLPATVRSRLQHCLFTPVAIGVLASALQSRGANKATADELAEVSGGRPGLALRWMSDPATYAKYKKVTDDFLQICLGPIGDCFVFTESIAKESALSRADLLRLLDLWTLILRDALLVTLGEVQLVRHRYLLPLMVDVASVSTEKRWRQALVELIALRRRLEAYSNRRLALNTFFFTLSV